MKPVDYRQRQRNVVDRLTELITAGDSTTENQYQRANKIRALSEAALSYAAAVRRMARK